MTARGRGLFAIEVDAGGGFRAATAAEVDAALQQRELFGAAEYPTCRNRPHARSGGGQRAGRGSGSGRCSRPLGQAVRRALALDVSVHYDMIHQ